jgi:hypothetical protein
MTPEEARAELARRELARRAAAREARRNTPRARGTPGTLVEEVGSTLSTINRGIPFAQDLVNFGGGVRGMLDGSGYQAGVERQRANSNELQQDFRNRRPNAAAFAEGTGNLSGAIPIGRGAQVVQQGATRGLPLLLGQTRNAAITGAGAGYLFGATTGDAPNRSLLERNQLGNEAAGAGAALGAATPAAVNLVGAGWRATNPLREAIGRGVNNLPEIAPRARQGVGSMGGQMFAGTPTPPARPAAPPPQPPRIPRAAMGTIDRMANNARMTPDQVETALAEARRNPQGEVLVDIFEDTGVRRFRPIVQGPGQTGNNARQISERRALEAAERIERESRRSLNVGETRAAAMARLENDYRDLSAEAYGPLWRQEWTPRQEALYQRRIAPLMRDQTAVGRTMREAEAAARETFEFDVANGRATGSFDDNRARALHYMKMELGEIFEDQSREAYGARAARDNSRRAFYRTFSDLLDPPPGTAGRFQGHDEAIIPGYREITSRAGDFHAGRRAIEAGQGWLKADEADVARELARMTPFERYHARVGLADEIRLESQGTVDGDRNPIAVLLRRPKTQAAIRAAFDTPQQAADFLSSATQTNSTPYSHAVGSVAEGADDLLGTIGTQNRLVRNAREWGAGSTTAGNLAYGEDEAFNAAVDTGAQVATDNPLGALRRGMQGAANALSLGHIERVNNVRGDNLLRRVDTQESTDFARAVVEDLRRRDAVRRSASAASQAGSAAGGSQQGRD